MIDNLFLKVLCQIERTVILFFRSCEKQTNQIMSRIVDQAGKLSRL